MINKNKAESTIHSAAAGFPSDVTALEQVLEQAERGGGE